MITEEDFSLDALKSKMKKPEIGAIVTFLGVVRADSGGEIKGMKIEMNEAMAEKEFEKLKREALETFHLEAVEIVHRKGSLEVGDSIVAILAGAKHRKEAFRACEYLIEELRVSKAIMMKEFF